MRHLIVTALIGAFLTGTAWAGEGDRDWTSETCRPYAALFDPATIVSVEGVIVNIGTFRPAKKAASGVELVLRLDRGDLRTVDLAPEWFLKEIKLKLKKGDHVSVVGSAVKRGARPLIIATDLTRGDQLFVLREADGRPLWAPPPPEPPSI